MISGKFVSIIIHKDFYPSTVKYLTYYPPGCTDPYFTDKGINHDNITLVENEETVSENKELSETLKNFFSEADTNLLTSFSMIIQQ